MFKERIVINGKRISNSKFEVMLNDALENVVLTGFFSIDELEKTIMVNGHYNRFMVDKLLDRLYSTYSSSLVDVRKKSLYDKTAATNVIILSEKLEIIVDLMEKRAQDTIKNIRDNEEYYDYDNDEDDIFDETKIDEEEDDDITMINLQQPVKLM